MMKSWYKNVFTIGMLTCLSILPQNLAGCSAQKIDKINYRIEMVNLIEDLHNYTKSRNPKFELIGNNGLALFKTDSGYNNTQVSRLLGSVDGIIMEEYNYGWEMQDDKRTASAVRQELDGFLQVPKEHKLPILNIDYCGASAKIRKAYKLNSENEFIGFVADSRQLDNIPKIPEKIYNENNANISALKDVKNFLILLNPENFRNKQTYLKSLQATNYDLLIIDLTFNGQDLSKDDIAALKIKKNGSSRLVFAYMSVGEAEEYRPYWKASWNENMPSWIANENEHWEGNYKVKYWSPEWKSILFGNTEAYVDQILVRGFDGSFMDVIDAFYYFENLPSKQEKTL